MLGGEYGGERAGLVAHVAGSVNEVCAEEEDVDILRGECGAGVCVEGDADVGVGVGLDNGGDALGDFDAFEEGAGFEDVDVEGTMGGRG